MAIQIDKPALRAKYLAERDKRLRPDGNEQYIEPTGRFASYLEDPYIEPVPRQPLFDLNHIARCEALVSKSVLTKRNQIGG